MAEHRILYNGLPRLDSLEELPEMRPQVVVIVSLVARRLRQRLLPRLRIMFFVPFLEVCVPQPRRQCVTVVAWGEIDSGLRQITQTKLRQFQNPFDPMNRVTSAVSVPSVRRIYTGILLSPYSYSTVCTSGVFRPSFHR
jgi:hypothetical protein